MKCYAEKIMHVRDAQVTPMHFHWRKREDIIDRGGGNLIVELWNADSNEQTADSDITVVIDSCARNILQALSCACLPAKVSACRPACITAFGRKPALAMFWLAKSLLSMTTTTITTFYSHWTATT